MIWYPGINNDIVNLVKSCYQCQTVASKPPQTSSVELPIPKRPWSRIHKDHFSVENKTCFVVIDALSKYIECEIVPSVSVDDTVNALRTIFSRHGLCDTLVSDNASCFTASQFKEFLNNNGIHHIAPHSTTQIAPSVALNNRKYVTAKDRINPRFVLNVKSDVNSKHVVQFDVGDPVLALNLREGP